MKSKKGMLIGEINKMHENIKSIDFNEASERIEREVNEVAKQMYKVFKQSSEKGG